MDNPTRHPSRVRRWILNFLLLFAACFFAASTFLIWRVALLTYQIEEEVSEISTELAKARASLREVSAELQKVADRISRLEEKASSALGLEEIENILNEVNSIRKAPAVASRHLTADELAICNAEIDWLLERLYETKTPITYGGEEASSTYLYYAFRTKLTLYGESIKTPEEMIAQIAARTMSGHPYIMELGPSERLPLKEWLSRELTRHRKEKQPEGGK